MQRKEGSQGETDDPLLSMNMLATETNKTVSS